MVMVRSCQLAYGGRYQDSGSGGSTVHIISLRLVLPHLYYSSHNQSSDTQSYSPIAMNCDRCSPPSEPFHIGPFAVPVSKYICHPKDFHSASHLRDPAYNLRRTRFTEMPTYLNQNSQQALSASLLYDNQRWSLGSTSTIRLPITELRCKAV